MTSFTDSNKTYHTTTEDCDCLDYQYRGSKTGKPCKHIRLLRSEINRAMHFHLLFLRFDCRANGDEHTHRCNFELSLGY